MNAEHYIKEHRRSLINFSTAVMFWTPCILVKLVSLVSFNSGICTVDINLSKNAWLVKGEILLKHFKRPTGCPTKHDSW